MKARVYVSLKPTVVDPQGQTIRAALNSHGHPMVSEVRQGKYFDLAMKLIPTTQGHRRRSRRSPTVSSPIP